MNSTDKSGIFDPLKKSIEQDIATKLSFVTIQVQRDVSALVVETTRAFLADLFSTETK